MRIGNLIAGMLVSSLLRGRGQRAFGGRGYSRRRGSSLLSLLMLGGLGLFGYQQFEKKNQQQSLPTTPIIGRVSHVVDGDTFHLGGLSIRLWGIDAPERDTKYYAGATNALQSALRGRTVTCQPLDRSYERIVASCSLGPERDLSRIMVRTGWAKDLPSKSGGAHRALEQQARSEKRGIWKN